MRGPRAPHPEFEPVVPLSPEEAARMVAADLHRHDALAFGRSLPLLPSELHRREFLSALQELERPRWPGAFRAFRAYLKSARYEIPGWLLDLEREAIKQPPAPGGAPCR